VGPRSVLDTVTKKIPSPCRESNLDRPAHSRVTIPTELSLFLIPDKDGNCSLHQYAQNNSGAHPASSPLGPIDPSSRIKKP
jgi:hypothetical protein